MCGGGLMIRCLSSRSTISPHHDKVKKEMHSKPVMVWVRRQWSCKLGGCNQVSLEIHMQAMIMLTWRLYSREFRHTLRGCDRKVRRSIWRPRLSEIGEVYQAGQSGCRCSCGGHDGSWHYIHWLTCNYGMQRIMHSVVCRVIWDWPGVEDSRFWDDAVCGGCSIQWMLSSVNAVLQCMVY